MSRSVHHLMIVSDGAVMHNKLYDSARSLGADLIEFAQNPEEHDAYVVDAVRNAMDEHDEDSLPGDYPDGVLVKLPDAEDYIDLIRETMQDHDLDVYVEALGIPEPGADELFSPEAVL